MGNMLEALFGSLKINKKSNFIIVPLKYLYILFSVPCLIFAFLLGVRGGGFLGSPKDEKIGVVKKILLHFANVFWSYCIWLAIIKGFLKL